MLNHVEVMHLIVARLGRGSRLALLLGRGQPSDLLFTLLDPTLWPRFGTILRVLDARGWEGILHFLLLGNMVGLVSLEWSYLGVWHPSALLS